VTLSVGRTQATPPDRPPERVITAKVTLRQRLVEIWGARQLLLAMVRKELKVKYKGSALGFVWSLLNPTMYLVIFYLVFSVFLKNGIPLFPIWLLCGLLVWNFISMVVPGATGSVVANASLVKKVSFPREILPLSNVGAGLVHFFLQMTVLIAGLVLFQRGIDLAFLALVPLAVLTMVVLAAALGVLLAAINVYVRDAMHLIELALLAWFWMTPIAYPFRQVSDKLAANDIPIWLMNLNPAVPIVTVFQRAFYNRVTVNDGTLPLLPEVGIGWHLGFLLIVLGGSTAVLVAAMRLFRRLEGNFAEEL
jgi:ABC-2 type transport system permease protein